MIWLRRTDLYDLRTKPVPIIDIPLVYVRHDFIIIQVSFQK